MNSDCADREHLASIAMAISRIRECIVAISATETIALENALGRVSAEELVSPIDLPPWDNSSVDGYALRSADPSNALKKSITVSQRIPAGSMGTPLALNSAARIFTGAPLPQGADAVVMQEHCSVEGQSVVLNAPAVAGQCVRRRGEDVKVGDMLIKSRQVLRPQDIGIAASVGVANLRVARQCRVGIVATGDELVMPGQPLPPGKIYNTNLPMLRALVQQLGCSVKSYGLVADNLNQTERALQQASNETDIVLSSGGVSVGEEDHIRAALQGLGKLDFWRIAVKPGKPLAFGQIGDTPFLGLPGNPVSAWVTFCLFAVPAIRLRQGADVTPPQGISARANFRHNNQGPREEYARARLTSQNGSAWNVEIYPNQSSGAFSSIAWSEGLVKIEAGRHVMPGDEVTFYHHSSFISA